jgi:hypothetical protein
MLTCGGVAVGPPCDVVCGVLPHHRHQVRGAALVPFLELRAVDDSEADGTRRGTPSTLHGGVHAAAAG